MSRIYADFNGIQPSRRNPFRLAVPLDTFGSLRDLANLGIQLKSELTFTIYDYSDDEEDLEGYATVYWDPPSRTWIAELDERGYQYVPKHPRSQSQDFLCISCRIPLHEVIRQQGLSATSICPNCHTRIHTPIAPPNDISPRNENGGHN